jgi:prolipoprotein diacylglyceryltransferase
MKDLLPYYAMFYVAGILFMSIFFRFFYRKKTKAKDSDNK